MAGKSVDRDSVDGRVGDLVERRAIADGWHAGDAGEDARAAREDLLFLLAGLALERLVQVSVMPDLVAAAVYFGHDVGPPLGRPARHEERRRDAVSLEEVQDERHAHFRPVGAL